MKRFLNDDLDQGLLMPPSLHDWLPQAHRLDLSEPTLPRLAFILKSRRDCQLQTSNVRLPWSTA